MSDLLLDITGLRTYFHTEDKVVRAVDLDPQDHIRLKRGETLGVQRICQVFHHAQRRI